MFTDRFIKVPVKVYDVQHKELTGEENLEDSEEHFLPLELSNYRRSYSDEFDRECVQIVFKNGDKTLVYLTMKEFQKLLNDHQK